MLHKINKIPVFVHYNTHFKTNIMTAIEWVINYLNNVKPSEFCSIETIREILEQAKEMEKQQIEISDEEIAEKAEEFELTNGIYGFKHGVKWYREQLKKKQ